MKTPLRILHLEDNPNDVVLIRETIIAHGIDAEIMMQQHALILSLPSKKGPMTWSLQTIPFRHLTASRRFLL